MITFDINKYIKQTIFDNICPKVVCADSFTISVQASEWHYCIPRETLSVFGFGGNYTKVECAYPSGPLPKEWEEYGDGDDVYAYIPTELVNALVISHGGLAKPIEG